MLRTTNMSTHRETVTALLLLALGARASTSNDGVPGLDVRNHPRDVHSKRATDCGTWTMYCGGLPGNGSRGQGAEDGCNNACYYINNVDPNFMATYNTGDNSNARVQPGCQTQQGTVCNDMPFSQRFYDPLERIVDVNQQQYECDEFPMAEMSQPNFAPGGGVRNSLQGCFQLR